MLIAYWIGSAIGKFLIALFITRCVVYALRKRKNSPLIAFCIGLLAAAAFSDDIGGFSIYFLALGIIYWMDWRKLNR